MVKYTCIRPCYFNERSWVVGEVYTSPSPDPRVPRHFVLDEEEKVAKAVVEEKEKQRKERNKPITAKEIAEKRATRSYADEIPPEEMNDEDLASKILDDMNFASPEPEDDPMFG